MSQSSRPRRAQRQRPPSSHSTGPDRGRHSGGGSWKQYRLPLTHEHTIPGVAILPLRLFLGITFVYAGIQKLADPGFFRAGSSTYIGHQLVAFSQGSPIAFLLRHFVEFAVIVGALTIATEIAIGCLVLLGLLSRPAALVGLVLNLMFFLSASWHTYPFFYGSDIVFVMCWLTLALTGPGPLALDTLLREPLRARLAVWVGPSQADLARALLTGPVQAMSGAEPSAAVPEEASHERPGQRLLTRGEALIASAAAVVLIILGVAPRGGQLGGTLAGGSSSPASPLPSSPASPVPSSPASPGPSSPASPVPATPGGGGAVPAGYRKIGNVSQLPANTAGTVSDPQSGDPAIIVHTAGSHLYAYDAICTHAGCTVQYDPQQKLIVCPCHGGAFDPAQGAQVVSGPPPSPLNPIQMQIDAQGNIFIK
jgi:thiosulfate dehydrogenase (quinone) large subunit